MQNHNDMDKIRLEYEAARANFEKMEKKLVIASATFPRYPSKDGYYRMQVKDSSAKSGRKMIFGRTLEELQEKYYQIQKKGMDGCCNKTVHDVFELVQSEKLKYVKFDEDRISVENTVQKARNNYKRFIAGTAIDNKYISDVSIKDLDDVIELNVTRYDLKIKAFYALRGLIRSIFDLAFQKYWITDNLFLHLNFKKYSRMIVSDAPIEDRCHSRDDIKRMLDYIHMVQENRRNSISPYALELQIIAALRRGEVSPLKWEHTKDCLDIMSEMIECKASAGTDSPKYAIVKHTKTHKNRKYPLTTELKEFLVRLKQFHEQNGIDSPYLFPVDNEYGCITVKSIYSFYYRMCKALDIPTSRDYIKGTHAFRRTRITEVTNKSGGNIVMASKLFGNSPEIAEKHYYTGLDLEEAKRVLES